MTQKTNNILGSVTAFIWHFVRKQKISFSIMLILSILVSICTNIFWPAITGNIVDVFAEIETKSEVWNYLKQPLIFALMLWIGMELMHRAKGVIMGVVFPRLEAGVRAYSFETVLQHSNDYFKKKQSASVSYRIDDISRSSKTVVDIVISIFIPLTVSILASSAILFLLHWSLSLIFCAWLILHSAVMIFCSIQGINLAVMQSSARSDVQSTIVDIIRNQANVRAFNGLCPERQILKNIQNNELNIYRRVVFYVEKSKFFLGILSALAVSVLLYRGIMLWSQDIVTTGSVIFVINAVLNIVSMMWYAVDEMNYLLVDIGITRKSLDIISGKVVYSKSSVSAQTLRMCGANSIDDMKRRDIAEEIAESVKSEEMNADFEIVDGSIKFENVSFGYDAENKLFKLLNVEIKAKQKVALVGFSGSGKTSFVNMIMRLYDPDGGVISIDGRDIRSMDLAFLRDNIAMIQQEPILFNRSIMANIRYGRHDATDDDVIKAAQRANCHDVIAKLSQGYESMVGEGGSLLSGGERQRLALARAFLKDAPILIMDEPTASQDVITERQIQKGLRDLMQNRTVLVIAHRLTHTTPNMDRIIVFDEGKIIEDGSHEELLALRGYYAKLWQLQQQETFFDLDM